jgi:hypothetical protein
MQKQIALANEQAKHEASG